MNEVTKIGRAMEQNQDKDKKEFSVAGFLKDKGLSDKEVEEFISHLKDDLRDKYSSKEREHEDAQEIVKEAAEFITSLKDDLWDTYSSEERAEKVDEFLSLLKDVLLYEYHSKESEYEDAQGSEYEYAQGSEYEYAQGSEYEDAQGSEYEDAQGSDQPGEYHVSKTKGKVCARLDPDILNNLLKSTTDPASLDWLRLFNELMGRCEREEQSKGSTEEDEDSDALPTVCNFSAILAAQEMSDIWDLLYDLLPVRRMISDRVSELSKSRHEYYSDEDVKLIGVAQVLRALDNAASGEEFKVERKSVRQTHLDREVFYRAVDVSYAGEVLVRIADVGYVAHCSRVLWYNPALPYLYDRVMIAPSGAETDESMDMEHLLFWHVGMTGKQPRFLNDEELDEFLSLFFTSGIVKGLSTQSSPARGIVDSMVPEARSKCIYAAASGKPLS